MQVESSILTAKFRYAEISETKVIFLAEVIPEASKNNRALTSVVSGKSTIRHSFKVLIGKRERDENAVSLRLMGSLKKEASCPLAFVSLSTLRASSTRYCNVIIRRKNTNTKIIISNGE